jgi:hypothetical protein
MPPDVYSEMRCSFAVAKIAVALCRSLPAELNGVYLGRACRLVRPVWLWEQVPGFNDDGVCLTPAHLPFSLPNLS